MSASYFSSLRLRRLINQQDNTAFMLTESLFNDRRPHIFTDFHAILTFNYGNDVNSFFEKIETFLSRGYWVCGYFTYEFGYFLEPALRYLPQDSDGVFAWLGVSKKPLAVRGYEKQDYGKRQFDIKNIRASISANDYAAQIEKIKYFLEEGQTYQVNYTFKNKFEVEGSIFDFYESLKRVQPSALGAAVNNGRDMILSFSPELFFRIENRIIQARPMKGTAARGSTPQQDEINKQQLSRSSKTRAENIMIVDLLRNDLGRIAEKVRVKKLFEIEKHRTLYQMTSTIEARLRREAEIKDIFSSLFPCGSVTGAPKIRTMQIIKEIEPQNRGVYTGAIGYFSPRKQACFSVAIRTISLRGRKAEMGIGGGIVYDSCAKDEYAEAVLKSKFLREEFPEFSLIESILWDGEKGYFLLERHLKRLKQSCNYFSVPLDASAVKNKLKILEESLVRSRSKQWKIRVLVNIAGKISIEKEVLTQQLLPVKIKVSSVRVNPDNEFLYHKTTHRKIYEQELKLARQEGFFEVIFLNDRNELTEGAVSNIFIEKNAVMATPAVKSGLLAGVLRGYLLDREKVFEKTLYLDDIRCADRIYIGNSVRRLVPAVVFSLSKAGLYSII